MTRNEAKQLKQVMQQSAAESMASENSTTSIYVTSSEAWLNRESNASQADTRRRLGSGTLGLDLLTGNTSIGTPSVQRGGIKGREILGSSEADRAMAKELGLAAESSPGFFDSSQATSQELSIDLVNAYQDESVHATTSSSLQTPSHRSSNIEVVINAGSRQTSSRSAVASVTPLGDPETPLARKKGKESKKSKKGSVGPSDTFMNDAIENTSIDVRPKRSTVAPKNYTPPWNADGTVIKSPKKKKDRSIKESGKKHPNRARKSSVNGTPSSTRGNQAEDAIVLDDDDNDDDESQGQAGFVERPSEDLPLDQDEVAIDNTMDDDAEKTDSDYEVVGNKSAKQTKVDKRRKSNIIAEEEDISSSMDEDTIQSRPSSSNLIQDRAKRTAKPTIGRNRKSRMVESDDDDDDDDTPGKNAAEASHQSRQAEEIDDEPEATHEIETPIKAGRGDRKSAKKEAKAKSKVTEAMLAIAQEKMADANEEEEGKENEDDEEDEAEPARSIGLTDKAAILVEASTNVNAGRFGKEKKEKKESSGSSSSSSSSLKSTILSKVSNISGKPLSSLLSSRPRVPGLIKRKIAPLLTHLGEPPAKRKAIPIPKSRRPKEEEMDSDEERARANETPEERMARYIQEMGEEAY